MTPRRKVLAGLLGTVVAPSLCAQVPELTAQGWIDRLTGASR